MEILNDKSIKPKEKIEKLSEILLNKTMSLGELIVLAQSAKDYPKATCKAG